MPWPLIFTHYGNSDYLAYTLESAFRTNSSSRRLVLLGDESNYKTALDHGWEHFLLRSLTSRKRDEFNARFYWVQGPFHNPVKGNGDWLRYVSDRFFALEAFVISQNLDNIWHFDSDTMILHDLALYEPYIEQMGIECTTLCNGACPSGFISMSLLSKYTASMINDYQDDDFLRNKQRIFNEKQPAFAFTEMEAFHECESRYSIKKERLSDLFSDNSTWFDDCICQSNGFEFIKAPSQGKSIKALYAKNKRIFCSTIEGKEYEFATVNCSWVDTSVFDWIQSLTSCDTTVSFEQLNSRLQISLAKRCLVLIAACVRTAFYSIRDTYRKVS